MRDVIADAIDNLTYNNYAWNRRYHGVSAERMAKVFPLAEKYEERYQEDLKRLQRAA